MNSTGRFRPWAWAAGQVGAAALVLLGASLLLFALAQMAPGAGTDEGRRVSGSEIHETQPAIQKGDPWVGRYVQWASGLLRGDFGTSSALQRGRPVIELVGTASRRSLVLAGGAMTLALGFAVATGAARRRWPDSILLGVGVRLAHLGSTLPVFILVYLVVVLVNPLVARGGVDGWWALPSWFPFPSRAIGVSWLMAAVILAVGDGFLADLLGGVEAEIVHAEREPHLVGARLLGLARARVVARGAAPGVATHVARRATFLLGSMVVLESALGWPGLGYLAWRAAAERDLPVLLGAAIVLAAVVRGAVLVASAFTYWADPRYRETG